MICSWSERTTNHIGTETRFGLFGSSEEYWTMGDSPIQQYRVGEDGLLVVKPFRWL